MQILLLLLGQRLDLSAWILEVCSRFGAALGNKSLSYISPTLSLNVSCLPLSGICILIFPLTVYCYYYPLFLSSTSQLQMHYVFSYPPPYRYLPHEFIYPKTPSLLEDKM